MDKSEEYLFKLNNDLIAQFKQQPNTQTLMSAVAKQLQSLYEAQEQLNALRWISSAEGKQLDGIGDIVVMARVDAARLELGKESTRGIDDETYRKYLRYKMFLNTSTGTRKEIMKALRFFWDEAPLYYSVEPNHPATIFVDTPELAPDVPIEGLLEAPIIKPAGVRFIVRIHTKTQNDESKIRLRGLSTAKITHTQVDELPHIAAIARFNHRNIGLSVVKITKTELREAEHKEAVGHFGLRVVGLSGIKRTTTQVSEVAPAAVGKSLRTKFAPLWQISRTDAGEYAAVAGDALHVDGPATTKITNTPLAAYGGD